MRLTRRTTLYTATLLCLAILTTTGCSTLRQDGWSRLGDLVPAERDSTELSESPNAVVDSVEVVYHWTAPTTGSPVHHYVCEWDHGQTDITISNKHRFTIPVIPRTRLRVAGVDSSDHQGPWSKWSEFYPERDRTDYDRREDFDGTRP